MFNRAQLSIGNRERRILCEFIDLIYRAISALFIDRCAVSTHMGHHLNTRILLKRLSCECECDTDTSLGLKVELLISHEYVLSLTLTFTDY